MQKQLKILLLEDSVADAELIQRELSKAKLHFDCKIVSGKDDFLNALQESIPDIILCDHALPQFNSLEALKIVREKNPEIPFVLVTGTVSEEFAVECMKAGVNDYILKSSLLRLPAAIEHLLEKRNREKEKEKINSSIHYARRIQQSILLHPEILFENFKDSFIIYQPKDIVSGDFYWFAKIKRNENPIFMMAVADCTGHGIPAAFLSIAGGILLNEIVLIQGITQPDMILSELNQKLRVYLKQDEQNSSSSDGMDIAFCVVDTANNKLEFAGANRPLFYFQNNELQIVKGDRYGIGGLQTKQTKKFTNHDIFFSKNDSIYLFTDGYADQFGGRKDQKMMTRNFIKLLKAIQEFDIKRQEQMLHEWLMKWKGILTQTDDILLLGIKF